MATVKMTHPNLPDRSAIEVDEKAYDTIWKDRGWVLEGKGRRKKKVVEVEGVGEVEEGANLTLDTSDPIDPSTDE